MIPYSRLTSRQVRILYDLLTVPHEARVSGSLMTLDHDHVTDVQILGGTVDHQMGESAETSASVEVLDPGYGLGLDDASLLGAQVHLDRLLRVEYGVRCPWGWQDIPIHTGRVVRPERGGEGILSLTCHGKETIANRPAWNQTRTWPRGTRVTDIIRTLARLWGEASERIDVPDWRARTGAVVELGLGTSMWGLAQSLAATVDAQLSYTARGIVRLRRVPTKPVYTFRDWANRPGRAVNDHEVGGTLLGEPADSHEGYGDGYVNTVWVQGKTSTRGADRPEAIRQAPRWHPLSPERNGMGGVPDVRFERIDKETLRTWAQVRDVADKRIERILLEYVDVAFDSLPVPGLEPGDVVAIATDRDHTRLRMREWSLPLDGSAMQVGTRSRYLTRRARR